MSEFYNNFLKPTPTVYAMWVIMAAIVIFSVIATRKMKDVPGFLQNIAEMAVSSLENFFEGVLGRDKMRRFFPILATFFIFIVVSNYSGLLPGAGELFTVPTSVLAVTAALAVIAFFTIHTSGFKTQGFGGYLKSFLKPLAFMLPITLLEQFTRPLSLALRLYGNIYGEEQVTETLFDMFPLLLPIVMQVLSLLFCLIQAMVFTMLLAVFIDEATEVEHEEPKPKKEKKKKLKEVEN